MPKKSFPDLELDAAAVSALNKARSLPDGAERTEALKKADHLQNAAETYRRVFSSETSNTN